MIQITSVKLAGGSTHQHIVELWWKNLTTSSSGSSTREQLVAWLENKANQAVVSDGHETAFVGIVRPATGAPYVRTYADGEWKDNLLALPRHP